MHAVVPRRILDRNVGVVAVVVAVLVVVAVVDAGVDAGAGAVAGVAASGIGGGGVGSGAADTTDAGVACISSFTCLTSSHERP